MEYAELTAVPSSRQQGLFYNYLKLLYPQIKELQEEPYLFR